MTPDTCFFCKIAQNTIEIPFVFETPQVKVFADIAPQAPIHWLAIHRQHSNCHLETSDPSIFSDLLEALQLAAKAHELTDYRLVINNGAQAGQSVFHLHVHLLAGRPFDWPPG